LNLTYDVVYNLKLLQTIQSTN